MSIAFGVASAFRLAVPDDFALRHETLWMLILLGVYGVTGLLIGRWWALLLLIVPVVLALPYGSAGDADGIPAWRWVAFDTATVVGWALVLGVAIRKAVGTLRHRRVPAVFGVATAPCRDEASSGRDRYI